MLYYYFIYFFKLLIQLRKENTLVVRHIEKCCTKIHEVQVNMRIYYFYDC